MRPVSSILSATLAEMNATERPMHERFAAKRPATVTDVAAAAHVSKAAAARALGGYGSVSPRDETEGS
jgi:hypothetical protein